MTIRDIYRDLHADIRKKKYFLIFTVILFLGAVGLGGIDFPAVRSILLKAVDSIRQMSQGFQNKALLFVIAKIFAHNAAALFIALFAGAVFFLIPIFAIIANGYIIGFILIPRLSDIGLLLPHGIFELPALALSFSYGIWLGLWPFARGRIETLRRRLRQCATLYFYVILPLLIIAATIEGSLLKYLLGH